MNKKNVFYDKYLVISFIYCIISLIKRLIDDFYFYCLPIVISLLFCIIYIRKNFMNVKKSISIFLLNILSAYVIFWGVYMFILSLELVIFPFPN